MTWHGENDDPGLELDRYGDGDEATLRRGPAAEAPAEGGLDWYEEDEVATAPWIRGV